MAIHPLQASGFISMGDINDELGRIRTTQISLNQAENGGVLQLRSGASPKPNANGVGIGPSALSEWYGYNHTPNYSYMFNFFSGASTFNGACAITTSEIGFLHSPDSILVIGSKLFSTDNRSAVFNGNNLHWTFGTVTSQSRTAKITSGGIILEFNDCVVADTTPPSTPLNLSGSQTSGNSVSLNWTASSDNVGVTQYYVYISLNHNGPYDFITSSTSPDASIGGLTLDGDYWFNVRALDANNNLSGPSAPINIVLFGGGGTGIQ